MLDVSDNRVESLRDLNLENSAQSLTHLNLDHNIIRHLERAHLLPFVTSLRHFRLSNNKQPLAVEAGAFVGFNFESLHLENNNISDFSFL